MADNVRVLPWPRFTQRPITCPPLTPVDVQRELNGHGIPDRGVGFEYIGMSDAAIFDGHKNLLAFGYSGLVGRICINVDSLEIVDALTIPGSAIYPVNSNLQAFSACIEIAIGMFPYYTYETADELAEQVAESLRRQLVAIDSTVEQHNGLWETFFNDVAMGDYAEEEFEPRPQTQES